MTLYDNFGKILRKTLILSTLLWTYGLLAHNPAQQISLPSVALSRGALIDAIQRQTDFRVAYTHTIVDTAKIVTLPALNVSVQQTLDNMVANSEIKYLIQGKHIALVPHKAKKVTVNKKPVMPGVENLSREIPEENIQTPEVLENIEETETNEVTTVVEEEVRKNYYSAYNDPDLFSSISGYQPRWAVKTNLFYTAYTLTPNLSVEFGLSPKTSIEFTGSYNPWNWKGDTENKKQVHMILQPEFRYWTCERLNGHFFGAHLLFSQYNINGTKVPMLFEKDKNYEGFAYGAGISYGYHLPLSTRWGLEFNVGLGGVYLDYDLWNCGKCGDFIMKDSKWYFGFTKIGVSAPFIIK